MRDTVSEFGPLKGMRVVELTQIVAGPVCGVMLADMGADVVKVEKTEGGDDSRRSVPPDINGESAAFMMLNRNKRGIALNLKTQQGRDAFLQLVRQVDCLVENFRHDTMKKLGLDYDVLKEINPGLIYCEISGFGRSGPYARRGGFDLIAQGMSGLMSITGEGEGRPPVKVGAPISDITAGILAATGCAAAYVHKLKTGEGQRIDTSLFEAAITQTYVQSAICLMTGVSPGPMGSAHPLNAPYQAFRTEDGWLNLGAANDSNWERALKALGADELGQDERFSSNKARMKNRLALEDVLNDHFQTKTTAEWLEALEAQGVPAGPVLSVGEMHTDPQTLAREMVTETDHLKAGRVKTIGLPIKFQGTPGGVRRPAPVLGQHTREILSELGYDEKEADALCASGGAVAAELIDPELDKVG
ncbi:MAG: CaiB/BaiF CoA-transferase family protein [Filomicrobium sp.]